MRALVTGGSRGIGRAICLRLARDALARGEPAAIVVTATGLQPDLNALVAELQALGAQAKALPGDLNDPAVPARLVAEAVAFCGGLDVVVHNAGGSVAASLLKTKVENWDAVFNVNTRAFWLLGVAAHEPLKASGGNLVAIGSHAGSCVSPHLNAYPAAKAALNLLVQQMAYEFGGAGIRVNCVAPGFTMSRSTDVALADPDDKRAMGQRFPLRRVGEPEDIAGVVAFVAGPDAAYMTGEILAVDGGMRLTTMANILAASTGNWAAQRNVRNMRPSGATS